MSALFKAVVTLVILLYIGVLYIASQKQPIYHDSCVNISGNFGKFYGIKETCYYDMFNMYIKNNSVFYNMYLNKSNSDNDCPVFFNDIPLSDIIVVDKKFCAK